MDAAVCYLTFRCNYNCPYCEEITKKQIWKQYKDIGYEYWLKFFKERRTCLISFTGGEPFLFEHFDKLIQELPQKHYFFIASNLSMPIDFLNIIKTRITSVAASLHPLESKFQLSKFIEKLQFLRECKIFTIVNYVAFPKQIDLISQMKKEIEEVGVSFNVDPFISSTYEYTADEQEAVKQFVTLKRTIEPWHEKSEDKLCSAGRDYICIVPNGDVFCCNTGFFYANKQEFKLGNITSTVKFANEDRLCDVPCPSACDLTFAKMKNTQGKRLTHPYKDNRFLPFIIRFSHNKYANKLYNLVR
jgi:MoaA/NifB/PqqE/SkfB family radical SAM enzyme